MAIEDEGGDSTVLGNGGLAPAMKVVRNRVWKREVEKEKRELAVAMLTEKFDEIMAKEEKFQAQ